NSSKKALSATRILGPFGKHRTCDRSASTIALFLPWVGFIVIAAHLPEAGMVFSHKIDPCYPFRALPEIPVRYDHAHGTTMLSCDRFSFPGMRDQDVRLLEYLAFHIRCVSVIGAEKHMAGFRLRLDDLQDAPRRNTAPMIVVAAPLRDAV